MAFDSFLGTAKSFNNVFGDAVSVSQSFVKLTGTTGIAGFVFDISDESAIELSSEITDHYLENNTPVQDHIALKPEIVTLKGYVGEFKRTVNDKKDFLQKATEKLVQIGSYAQTISAFSEKVLAQAENMQRGLDFDLIGTGGDLFQTYRDINIPADDQSNAFLYFEALWQSRQTFTIQTPYRYYTDMAIQSMKAIQTGDTIDESSFEITFKKIRTVQVVINTPSSENSQGRYFGQITDFWDRGLSKGKEVANNIGDWFA